MCYGGHANVFQPLVRANLDVGEHIRYIDITSRYPNIGAITPFARADTPSGSRDRSSARHSDPGGLHAKIGYVRWFPYRGVQGSVIVDNVHRFLSELRVCNME
jgi:hypothetical protein